LASEINIPNPLTLSKIIEARTGIQTEKQADSQTVTHTGPAWHRAPIEAAVTPEANACTSQFSESRIYMPKPQVKREQESASAGPGCPAPGHQGISYNTPKGTSYGFTGKGRHH
jgi:hypothetical protein